MVVERKTLNIKDKTVFEKITLRSDFKRMPKYFLENEACFMFLSRGAFAMRTPTHVIKLTEGEALLAKCGNYFFEETVSDGKDEQNLIVAIGAFFYPNIIQQIFKVDLDFQLVDNRFDATGISVVPLLKLFIDSVEHLLNHPEIADENLLLVKLKELIHLLLKTNQASKLTAFLQSIFSKSEYDFNAIVEKNKYACLKIEELAYLTNTSTSTFKRKFKALYGASPVTYFQQQKVDRAKQLLLVSDKSVGEIGYEVGFESVTHFNRVFKKITKQSPSNYRLSQSVKKLIK